MKITSIGMMISFVLLGCTCFFSYTEAQYQGKIPEVHKVELYNPLQTVFALLQRINPLINRSSLHGSPEDVVMTIPHETIVRYLNESKDAHQFYTKMRIAFIETLIHLQYPLFVTQPYQENGIIIVQSGDFKITKNITQQDSLDQLLVSKLSLYLDDFVQIKKLKKHVVFNTIAITEKEYSTLMEVFLFKTEQDLRDLGYQLVSWKVRVNEDVAYRRHNIQSAFNNMGNIKLVMPGEVFSTLRALRYIRGVSEYYYVDGLVTVGNGAVMMYGGGLCGVATALFQGTLTNRGLFRLHYKPHSIYYRNLYEADINGIVITDPGLDATIFSPVIDFSFQNIRPYPIIVGFSYDGEVGSEEQVFTLAKEQDVGAFRFIRSFKRGTYSCFTWEVNEKTITNCYRQVKNF